LFVKGRIRFERVGDIKVVKLSVKIKCYNSVWLMFNCRRYISPTFPLSFSEKEKLGKPKEEIGNLNGFEYMYCSDLEIQYIQFEYMHFEYMYLRYHIFVLILCIHISYFHGHDTLPLHGKTRSAIDEQTEPGSRKTPPTTHSNVRWRKMIRGKK
jgi:hypothetical protein